MKRVKMFSEEYDYDLLEKRVNQFLASIMPERVLDIQYRDCSNACSVMVVYEDEPAIAANPSPVARTFEDIYGGKR
jgi:hypothetical protein